MVVKMVVRELNAIMIKKKVTQDRVEMLILFQENLKTFGRKFLTPTSKLSYRR